jgi:hypothetical protein
MGFVECGLPLRLTVLEEQPSKNAGCEGED